MGGKLGTCGAGRLECAGIVVDGRVKSAGWLDFEHELLLRHDIMFAKYKGHFVIMLTCLL